MKDITAMLFMVLAEGQDDLAHAIGGGHLHHESGIYSLKIREPKTHSLSSFFLLDRSSLLLWSYLAVGLLELSWGHIGILLACGTLQGD